MKHFWSMKSLEFFQFMAVQWGGCCYSFHSKTSSYFHWLWPLREVVKNLNFNFEWKIFEFLKWDCRHLRRWPLLEVLASIGYEILRKRTFLEVSNTSLFVLLIFLFYPLCTLCENIYQWGIFIQRHYFSCIRECFFFFFFPGDFRRLSFQPFLQVILLIAEIGFFPCKKYD